MTSEERIQARIARDKVRRAERKAKANADYDNFDKVITVQNYHNALKKCKKGVMWKAKPQAYIQTGITNIYDTVKTVQSGTLPMLKNTKPIILYERGKKRRITPIQFDDRMTQRVICDYSMVPIFQRTLIYDNGASTQGKGTQFARDRMEKFFQKAIKEYGNDFYILTFDFKSFFDSIPHSTCYNVLNKNYQDERIVNLIMEIIRSYQRPEICKIRDKNIRERELNKLEANMQKGICLGSQVSQILALVVPNEIDHLIKDREGFKLYERFMDDGGVLHKSKEALKALWQKIKELCKKLGLMLNDKKTHIVKASKGISFLKVRYRVVNCKLVKTLTRSGIVRMRRKLKKFVNLVKKGIMTLDDVFNSVQAWLAHSKVAKAYKTVMSMMKLYDKLFNGYKIRTLCKKYRKGRKGVQYEVLQNNQWAAYRWSGNNLRAA